MLERLYGAIAKHPYVRATWRLVLSLDKHDAVRAANAMAFDTFLSLIPLLAMLGWAVAKLHERGDFILTPILRATPGPVATLIDEELVRLSGTSLATIAPISVVGFLWVSSSGLSTAMGVFETIFLAVARPWYIRRIVAIGCVIAGLILTSFLAALTVAVATPLGPTGGALVGVTMPTVMIIGALVAFFRIAVRRPPGIKRRVFPGVFVTVALWDLASIGYAYYVAAIARYATFYGSLAAVAILLFWIWLLAMALLVGGEVNAQLEGVRDPSWATPLPPAKKE